MLSPFLKTVSWTLPTALDSDDAGRPDSQNDWGKPHGTIGTEVGSLPDASWWFCLYFVHCCFARSWAPTSPLTPWGETPFTKG